MSSLGKVITFFRITIIVSLNDVYLIVPVRQNQIYVTSSNVMHKQKWRSKIKNFKFKFY